MRALLHYPPFQELEALWRAIHFLVRRADTDHNLSIHLIDISRDELTQDLAAESASFATRELLNAHGPWALLIGAYSFGAAANELQTLAALGADAGQFDTSFVSTG